MPNVSMSPSARYVTQSRVFDVGLPLGLLTDRRITFYAKKGYYGPEHKAMASSPIVSKRKLAKLLEVWK